MFRRPRNTTRSVGRRAPRCERSWSCYPKIAGHESPVQPRRGSGLRCPRAAHWDGKGGTCWLLDPGPSLFRTLHEPPAEQAAQVLWFYSRNGAGHGGLAQRCSSCRTVEVIALLTERSASFLMGSPDRKAQPAVSRGGANSYVDPDDAPENHAPFGPLA